MTLQEAIKELQEKYAIISSITLDKTFFITVSKYMDLCMSLQNQYPAIHATLINEFDKRLAELNKVNSPSEYQKVEKLLAKGNKINRTDLEDLNGYIMQFSSYATKLDTETSYAWYYLMLLWDVVINAEKLPNFLKGDNNIDSNLKEVFYEYRNIQLNKSSENSILTRENYFNYVTQIHIFFIDQLKKIKSEQKSSPSDPLTINSDLLLNKGVLSCNKLVLNLNKGTLSFNDNQPISIEPENQEIRLLTLLLENKGNIVEYKNIAERLKNNWFHPGMENEEVGEYLKIVKIKLRDILYKCGVTPEFFRKLIVAKKNKGYILTCA